MACCNSVYPHGRRRTRLLSRCAVRFNLRHRRAEPLFEGRHRAILAGEDDWISEVNRYIHLNPARLESLDLGKQRHYVYP